MTGTSRGQGAGHDRSTDSSGGYHLEKGVPASAQVTTEPSNGQHYGVGSGTKTAAGSAAAAAAANANTSSGTTNLSVPTATTPGSDSASRYQQHAEDIVEEERQASEKLPQYPGLTERFQLIMKMGE